MEKLSDADLANAAAIISAALIARQPEDYFPKGMEGYELAVCFFSQTLKILQARRNSDQETAAYLSKKTKKIA